MTLANGDTSTLNELQSIKAQGLTVERDLDFKQGTFNEVLARFRKERGQ